MVQTMQTTNEKPPFIVCIAYRQSSAMTGSKDPTEQPNAEEVKQMLAQSSAVVKKNYTFQDFTIKDFSVEYLLDLLKDIAETFRLENLKTQFQQFREQNQSLFDLFSFSKST